MDIDIKLGPLVGIQILSLPTPQIHIVCIPLHSSKSKMSHHHPFMHVKSFANLSFQERKRKEREYLKLDLSLWWDDRAKHYRNWLSSTSQADTGMVSLLGREPCGVVQRRQSFQWSSYQDILHLCDTFLFSKGLTKIYSQYSKNQSYYFSHCRFRNYKKWKIHFGPWTEQN